MLFGFFLTVGVAVLSAGLRSFQNSFAQKAGALGILAATFLGVYFITGSWMWGFVGCDELALSAVAGNSHSDSRASTSKGKTASTEKPSVFGHVPSARVKSRARSRTKGLSMSATRVGIGRITGSFSDCFIVRKIEPRPPSA